MRKTDAFTLQATTAGFYSWLMPIKYDTEQLFHEWIEWIDTGNNGSWE